MKMFIYEVLLKTSIYQVPLKISILAFSNALFFNGIYALIFRKAISLVVIGNSSTIIYTKYKIISWLYLQSNHLIRKSKKECQSLLPLVSYTMFSHD